MLLKKSTQIIKIVAVVMASMMLVGCGEKTDTTTEQKQTQVTDAQVKDKAQTETSVVAADGQLEADIEDTQSASNGHIDFDTLKAQNDEIIGWLKVPGTDIDCPILQSQESDDYYRAHNEKKESDEKGAAFIEMPTMPNMCDFNTVIHGGSYKVVSIFEGLVNFLDPEFFEANEEFYIYLPDNQLTYTVWAAFTRDNTSLIREYSFAEAKGDREFVDYVINERIIGKQLREGFEDVDEYNFLTTLTIDNPIMDSQVVVIGVLTGDAAGTIDRQVIEELDLGPDLLAQ